MKRILLAAVALMAATLSTSAFAQTWWDGFELGVQGGYGWGTSSGSVGVGHPYSFSPDGGLGGGHAGYNWQNGPWVFGLEGDVEGGDISGRQLFAAGPAIVGIPSRSVFSSLDFDASVRGKVGWAWDRSLIYATGGVAFGDVDTKFRTPIGGPVVGGGDSIRVGWTGGAGFAYAFTPNWEGNIEYRYTDLGSNNYVLHVAGAPVATNEFNYNMIRVGLTYRFAPPPPAPPVVVPAVAPAPPPPMMARTFLVFFDFDRYNLTPDARRVIDAAAATYRSGGHARIDVSGFTDLAGTQAYNLRLSQRRADAVAADLMRHGVPKDVMDVKWFGKEHPRVPTPDGVREPQNRRVEIVMP